MAASVKWYGTAAKNQWGTTAANRIDYATDTIKVALVTATYTFDQDAHDFFNDITGEIVGTGYTAGGQALGTKTLTYDTATNQIRFDAADPSWTTSTITAAVGAVFYKDTGTASTSSLMAFMDFGGSFSSTGGTFTITLDATGAMTATAT